MTDSRDSTEILDTDTCWQLLAGAPVGRLVVWSHPGPDIFPINHVVEHDTIVFRTGPGSKLDAAVNGPGVAYEADGYDDSAGEAWSVVVRGVAHEVERADELADARSLPLFPWEAGYKLRWVRITPERVSGRRFRRTAPEKERDPG